MDLSVLPHSPIVPWPQWLSLQQGRIFKNGQVSIPAMYHNRSYYEYEVRSLACMPSAANVGKGRSNRDYTTVQQIEGVVWYLTCSARVSLCAPVIAGCETAKKPHLFVLANVQLLPKVQYFLAHSLQLKLPSVLIPRPKTYTAGRCSQFSSTTQMYNQIVGCISSTLLWSTGIRLRWSNTERRRFWQLSR